MAMGVRPGHLWEQRAFHFALTFQKPLHDPMGLDSFLSWLTPAILSNSFTGPRRLEVFHLTSPIRDGSTNPSSFQVSSACTSPFPHSHGTLVDPFQLEAPTTYLLGSGVQSAERPGALVSWGLLEACCP